MPWSSWVLTIINYPHAFFPSLGHGNFLIPIFPMKKIRNSGMGIPAFPKIPLTPLPLASWETSIPCKHP